MAWKCRYLDLKEHINSRLEFVSINTQNDHNQVFNSILYSVKFKDVSPLNLSSFIKHIH